MGETNHTLYLLQNGMLTSYLEKPDGSLKRLHTMRREAFVNEDSLFLDLPVSMTVIADEDSKWLLDTRSTHDRLHYFYR